MENRIAIGRLLEGSEYRSRHHPLLFFSSLPGRCLLTTGCFLGILRRAHLVKDAQPSPRPVTLRALVINRCGGTIIAVKRAVKETSNIPSQNPQAGVDMVDLMEEMLFQRASSGIRPMLYVSSYTDFECSMLILLDDMGEVQWSGAREPVRRQVGYHMIPN